MRSWFLLIFFLGGFAKAAPAVDTASPSNVTPSPESASPPVSAPIVTTPVIMNPATPTTSVPVTPPPVVQPATPDAAMKVCAPSPVPAPPKLALGAAVQILLPTNMPEFITTTPIYGPQIAIPIDAKTAWVSDITFGMGSGVTALLTESALRFSLPTPFLPFFVVVGVQYLHYVAPQNSYNFAGIHFGPGLVLPLEKVMDLQLGLKFYLQSKFMTTLGGALVFPL
jgi:hypothetical protein